jgi:quercetin dioxygenase-like cupin family protein
MSGYPGFYPVSADRYPDDRGVVSVIEHGARHGFVAARTFVIDFADNAVRAQHVTSCSEMIMTLRGAVRIDLDNGQGPHSTTAREGDGAFFVAAGVWRGLVALEPGTRVLVLADAPYAVTHHPAGIDPDMIQAAMRSYPG